MKLHQLWTLLMVKDVSPLGVNVSGIVVQTMPKPFCQKQPAFCWVLLGRLFWFWRFVDKSIGLLYRVRYYAKGIEETREKKCRVSSRRKEWINDSYMLCNKCCSVYVMCICRSLWFSVVLKIFFNIKRLSVMSINNSLLSCLSSLLVVLTS